jgi:hypothetical protein
MSNNESSGQHVHDLAAELALGLVTGPERAAALAHLETCPACRAEVESLAGVVDDLLLATPAVEPPPGFESGVLARLADAFEADGEPNVADFVAPFPRRRRPVVRRLAALAAVILLVIAGVAIGRFGHHHGAPAVEVLRMQTPAGVDVGRVELGREPDSIFVALPGWKPAAEAEPGWYFLRMKTADGHTTSLGPVTLTADHLTWGSLTSVDPSQVREVSMVDREGHVYCSTTLI